MVARCFANSDALSLLTLGAHNELLSGDELTTVQLNRDWRRLVTAALYYYFRHKTDELSLDNEDMLDDLLADIYDAETFTVRLFRVERRIPASTVINSSPAAAQVTASIVDHTFTYPNARIVCRNFRLSNSLGTGHSIGIVSVEGESPVENGYAESIGTTAFEETAIGIYSGIETGVEKEISLFLQPNGGTASLAANTYLIWEIEEWE